VRVHLADNSELVSAFHCRGSEAERCRRDPLHFRRQFGLGSHDLELVRQGRSLLADIEPIADLRDWDDRRVLTKLCDMVERRQIWWLEPPPRLSPIWHPAESEPPLAPKITLRQETRQGSRPFSTLEIDAPTFPANVDQACLAQVLSEAAASGVPLCEECQAEAAVSGGAAE
jgi:hypothetical protein